MSKKIVKIKRFYNFFAPVYYWLLYPFFIKGWKQVAYKINGKKYKNVIELACNEAPALNFIDLQTNYTGIDIAEKTIKRAMSKYKKRQNIKFEVADIDNLSSRYTAEKYDCALLLYVLSVTPNPERLITIVHNLLQQNGDLLIVNHFSSNPFFKRIDQLLQFFTFGGVNFYHPFPTVNQLKGFNIVSEKRILVFWTFLHLKKI